MNRFGRGLVLFMGIVAGVFLFDGNASAKLASGQAAPTFSLKDHQEKTHDLAQMQNRPMIVLYFFDVDSKPSQEGLVGLNQLARQYKDADLTVWAITASPKEKVSGFAGSTGLAFPLLIDKSGVSDLYEAQAILPTVCIIGPGLKVMDYFQGGGKTTEIMLVRLAEREVERKQTQLAMAISDDVIKRNPQNIEAKAVQGDAALKGGNLDKAGQVFQELAGKGGQAEVLGKEGLAAVYARKGESDKALKLASEVEQKAPDRAYPHVIKGDILYAQNKTADAQGEYQKAVNKKQAAPYQKAVGYNQLGRLYAKKGDNEAARKLFDEALAIDPYYIEGTTNKGRTYEKEGKWDKAAQTYRQALSVEKSDVFASVLARNAQEMLDLQKDAKRKERVDTLVKELTERYRSQKKTARKDEDSWTSRPMILTFVDFQEKGSLSERDGLSTVLTVQLGEQLNASNRVHVVERAVMDRLLQELNIGSSELADPETALKLGKVLAAKLIGTGSLLYTPGNTMMSMRFIDSETSSIPLVINREIGSQLSLEKDLFQLNREILKSIISKYPLRGYVVKVVNDRVVINLGSKQGVVLGTKFDVLQEGETMEYKGKTLHGSSKATGQIEVVQVEPELCYAKIVSKDRPLKADDKVQERLESLALGDKNVAQ